MTAPAKPVEDAEKVQALPKKDKAPDIQDLQNRMVALKLDDAAQMLPELLTQAVRDGLSAPAVLDRLLRVESDGREERRIRTSLRLSGLPTGQTLANFDFAFQPAVERARIETLATGQWVREKQSLLLLGPPGVGKTHLATGLGIAVIQAGMSISYYRCDELLHVMRQDAHLAPAKLRRRKYMNAALLIVDEVGFDPFTREDANLFFRLVSYRYQRGSICITSNKAIKDWPEMLAGDDVIATAILDRLLHNCNVLNIAGRSYRLRDLEAGLLKGA